MVSRISVLGMAMLDFLNSFGKVTDRSPCVFRFLPSAEQWGYLASNRPSPISVRTFGAMERSALLVGRRQK